MAAPAPADLDRAAAEFEFEAGLDGAEIDAALLGSLDPEGFTDGGVVVGIELDPLHQGAETLFDPESTAAGAAPRVGPTGAPVAGGVPPWRWSLYQLAHCWALCSIVAQEVTV